MDGNSRTSGDHPVHDSLIIAQDQTSSLAQQVDYGLKLGPVPTFEHLLISWNTNEPLSRINIATIDGQLMSTRAVQTGVRSLEENVADLPSGMYVLTMHTNVGFQSKRFMKY